MQKLKEFRKRKGLTQEALAKGLGLAGASAICSIENNRINLTYPQTEKLLKMGATLEELFGENFTNEKSNLPTETTDLEKRVASLQTTVLINELILNLKDQIDDIRRTIYDNKETYTKEELDHNQASFEKISEIEKEIKNLEELKAKELEKKLEELKAKELENFKN